MNVLKHDNSFKPIILSNKMICKETPEGAGGYYALAAFARQLDSGAEKLGFYDVGDRKSAQREREEKLQTDHLLTLLLHIEKIPVKNLQKY